VPPSEGYRAALALEKQRNIEAHLHTEDVLFCDIDCFDDWCAAETGAWSRDDSFESQGTIEYNKQVSGI
jgi:hypothetical protein